MGSKKLYNQVGCDGKIHDCVLTLKNVIITL